ncbi:hypothetical protein RHMOL_Rhmol09G0215600 [Rhododendron molle]|uniref:Uncharacterized protein n=1 Tax=Rhododendron molle TaxID=49168 RepID=A0ACC0MFV5_RHOML|nr:hypothetical protein RHMOL_Rhmol09G0215600 [Rhododendron molle]
MNCCIIIVLLLLLQFATSSNNIPEDFTLNGYLKLDGTAKLRSNGLFTHNDYESQAKGHAFSNFPIQFKNSSNASVISFSTTFIFAIVPEYPKLSGHRIAFIISPNKEIPGALPSQYLGLFNETNMGSSSNHIFAVELDTVYSSEFDNVNDNHVGIDINGLDPIKSALADYFADQNGAFRNLSLISGDPMQVAVKRVAHDSRQGLKEFVAEIATIGRLRHPNLVRLLMDLKPLFKSYMSVTGF